MGLNKLNISNIFGRKNEDQFKDVSDADLEKQRDSLLQQKQALIDYISTLESSIASRNFGRSSIRSMDLGSHDMKMIDRALTRVQKEIDRRASEKAGIEPDRQ